MPLQQLPTRLTENSSRYVERSSVVRSIAIATIWLCAVNHQRASHCEQRVPDKSARNTFVVPGARMGVQCGPEATVTLRTRARILCWSWKGRIGTCISIGSLFRESLYRRRSTLATCCLSLRFVVRVPFLVTHELYFCPLSAETSISRQRQGFVCERTIKSVCAEPRAIRCTIMLYAAML